MNHLNYITLYDCRLPDQTRQTLRLSYEVFGQPLHRAPVVVVNHALTGNSTVTGKSGWWKQLIGPGKVIDLHRYTVIAFNIPGNGYEGSTAHLLSNYRVFTTAVIADLFWKGLDALQIKQLYAVIGGSLGGSIAWEMAIQRPKAITHLIPIATNIQASDWLIGQVHVQESILAHSSHPLEDARKHAMLLYRTPASMIQKFNRHMEQEQYAVECWLNYHGETLKNRFQLLAYQLMNHLLKTIGKELTEDKLRIFAAQTSAQITVIAIDSDYMFTQQEQQQTVEKLTKYGVDITYKEIQSIHGHDAFLLEYEQLNRLIKNLL
ncbi:alpha/beta fold hydrolase [Myroides sp. DF42-4-2]|uniref:alpha/beta fold hydrolase n=1 Tax=unclassified Myroides TaxID=2642485 RepID=UPI0025754C92|nr:alpha/beta fold hydrolase [Myroides sp. DF42-4-2]